MPQLATAGIDSTLEWLSFWDEGHYDPRDFAGWANFGFSKDVAQICRGAAMGQRHMLKVSCQATYVFVLPERHVLEPGSCLCNEHTINGLAKSGKAARAGWQVRQHLTASFIGCYPRPFLCDPAIPRMIIAVETFR